MHTNKLNYFIFQVTHSNVTSVKFIKVSMLNRPLSKMPTDTIELCNCSFDMQPFMLQYISWSEFGLSEQYRTKL